MVREPKQVVESEGVWKPKRMEPYSIDESDRVVIHRHVTACNASLLCFTFHGRSRGHASRLTAESSRSRGRCHTPKEGIHP